MLGAGGMATVFHCEDEKLDRSVAVKRLHAHSPEQTAQRFVREAKLGASLNHPNLVSVYDTVTDEEGVLIVMELVRGESLADALRRGPLETERALGMVRDLASALDHAHSHGVVHRDIKPANVLLRDDGMTKLVDLGIATAADVTRITQSGILLGTAAYMAPEQLEGGEAGPATDVYALSVVAFEALSGSRARSGRTPMEIAHEITTEGPPDLREVWDEAPDEAAEVLCRGMARNPADRPSSAGELADELGEALAGAATAGPTESKPEPALEAPSVPRREIPSTPRRGAAGAPPPSLPVRLQSARGRPGALPIALALIFLALAAVVAVAALSGGDGDEQRAADSGGQQGPRQPAKQKKEKPAAEEPQAQQPAAPAPAPAPEEAPPAAGGGGGKQLNDQGFALMQQGRYDEAIPVLEKAVASFPEGTSDLTYAYALYNLGRSLRLAGRPDEAIPVLERRLRIPNQTGTVRRELEAARKEAARS
jgi:tetratricopeptide (TPR) repeat protein